MSCCVKRMAIAIAWVILLLTGVQAEEVGARWGTEQREREYYRVVSVPIPKGQVIETFAHHTRVVVHQVHHVRHVKMPGVVEAVSRIHTHTHTRTRTHTHAHTQKEELAPLVSAGEWKALVQRRKRKEARVAGARGSGFGNYKGVQEQGVSVKVDSKKNVKDMAKSFITQCSLFSLSSVFEQRS